MRRFEFTTAINCGPRPFNPGDVAAESEIFAYLDSLLRQKQIVEVDAKLSEAKPPDIQTAAPKSTAKNK